MNGILQYTKLTSFHAWPSCHWPRWFFSCCPWPCWSVFYYQEQYLWESVFEPLPCSFLGDSSGSYQFHPVLSQHLLMTEIYLWAVMLKDLHRSCTTCWPKEKNENYNIGIVWMTATDCFINSCFHLTTLWSLLFFGHP